MSSSKPSGYDVEAEDVDRCRKCGARSHQLCDRYKLQVPVMCPRDALGRTETRVPDPEASLGAELCYEALRSTHDRFDPREVAAPDERLIELDFDSGDGR